jgi:hypothetical protein
MSKRTLAPLAAIAAACALSVVPQPAPARPAEPSPSCLSGAAARVSACGLIADYFEALDEGRPGRACSLLGAQLRFETGGPLCPRALAVSGGTPHVIVGVRRTTGGLVVLVDVGIHEFDHYRLLRWAALVGQESGRLKILATRRV